MKIVIARCNGCDTIVGEWIWKEGDIMNNDDRCFYCRGKQNG